MKKKLITLAVLASLAAVSGAALAEEAADAKHSHPEDKGTAPVAAAAPAEPASPHTFAYNVGLFSQYIFRGLTQTGEEPALQGGVDYTHASGFYLGAWASNVSWLEDGNYYENSSLEIDLYGGYRNSIGETGIGYDVGLLQYIYPGDELPGVKEAETTEVYGAVSWKWLQGKYSYVLSDGAFGFDDADGSWYAEINANIPIGESGFTAILHAGRQEFDGDGNDNFDYTDWKVGVSKSFSNGVNVGGYYTDTNADSDVWTDASGQDIGDNQFTVFVQKVF
jgi:uncharacterized protein (TIGR02001 family)